MQPDTNHLVPISLAAYMTEVTEKEINRAIDQGHILSSPVEKHDQKDGHASRHRRKYPKANLERQKSNVDTRALYEKKTNRRYIGTRELIYLLISKEAKSVLSPDGRRNLYGSLGKNFASKKTISIGPLEIKIKKYYEAIVAKRKKLALIDDHIERPADGDPIFVGSTTSVYRVAALAEGQTVAEIGEDYPSLTITQIECAIEFAKAHPKSGKPYPTRSFKRTMGDLANQGVFDNLHESTAEDAAKDHLNAK